MVERQKLMLAMEWNRQLDSFAETAVLAMAGNAKAMTLLGMFYDEESVDERCRDMRSVIKSISVTRATGRLVLEVKLGQCGMFVDACREIKGAVAESDEKHLAFSIDKKTDLLANAEYWYRRSTKVDHCGSAIMLAKLMTRNKRMRMYRVLRWLAIGFVMATMGIPLLLIIVGGVLCFFS